MHHALPLTVAGSIPAQLIETLRRRAHALKVEADRLYRGLSPELKEEHLHRLVDEPMGNAMATFREVHPDTDEQELSGVSAHLAALVHSFLAQ